MGHLLTVLQKKKVIVQDGFNRADNATSMGNANTGQAWQSLNGIFGITANQSYWVSGVSSCATVVDAGISNCILQATYQVFVPDARIYLRATDIDNAFLVGYVGASDAYQIYRRQGGVSTLLATNGTAANRDVIRVVAVGSSIKLYQNGNLLISVSDTFNQSVTKHGFGVFNGGSVALARFDNFLVEAL